MQDAIDDGSGTREWDTGNVYTAGPVRIVQEPGETPITPAQHRLAQALAYHKRYGGAALIRAKTALTSAEAAGDQENATIYAEMVGELKTIRAEALRAERRQR